MANHETAIDQLDQAWIGLKWDLEANITPRLKHPFNHVGPAYLDKRDADDIAYRLHGCSFCDLHNTRLDGDNDDSRRRRFCEYTHAAVLDDVLRFASRTWRPQPCVLDPYRLNTGDISIVLQRIKDAILQHPVMLEMAQIQQYGFVSLDDSGNHDFSSFATNANARQAVLSIFNDSFLSTTRRLLQHLTIRKDVCLGTAHIHGHDDIFDMVLDHTNARNDQIADSDTIRHRKRTLLGWIRADALLMQKHCNTEPWAEWVDLVMQQFGPDAPFIKASIVQDSIDAVSQLPHAPWHSLPHGCSSVEHLRGTVHEASEFFWLAFMATPAFQEAAANLLQHAHVYIRINYIVQPDQIPRWLQSPTHHPFMRWQQSANVHSHNLQEGGRLDVVWIGDQADYHNTFSKNNDDDDEMTEAGSEDWLNEDGHVDDMA